MNDINHQNKQQMALILQLGRQALFLYYSKF